MSHDKYKYCRKNQLFHNRAHYLNYLEVSCKGNELTFIENVLMFGVLYALNGYMRRHKQFKTQDEVVKYYLEVFGSEYRGDRIMHAYLDDLKYILALYD
jgi:hypothetical protein